MGRSVGLWMAGTDGDGNDAPVLLDHNTCVLVGEPQHFGFAERRCAVTFLEAREEAPDPVDVHGPAP